MVGHGRISVTGAVDLANSMVEDGWDHKAVSALASMGACNQHPGNNERDFFRWIKDAFNFSVEPLEVTMQLQEPGTLFGHHYILVKHHCVFYNDMI